MNKLIKKTLFYVGLAIGCVKKSYSCNGTVKSWQIDESLVLHENKSINITKAPFVQVSPQNATVNVIPNEEVPIVFHVSVNLFTLI